VSGFRPDPTPVLKPEPITPQQVTPEDMQKARLMQKNGQLFRLNETGDVVQINTGIVVGYDIDHPLALIAKNPIGPKVSDKFTP
jgi:hypothetical protein